MVLLLPALSLMWCLAVTIPIGTYTDRNACLRDRQELNRASSGKARVIEIRWWVEKLKDEKIVKNIRLNYFTNFRQKTNFPLYLHKICWAFLSCFIFIKSSALEWVFSFPLKKCLFKKSQIKQPPQSFISWCSGIFLNTAHLFFKARE